MANTPPTSLIPYCAIGHANIKSHIENFLHSFVSSINTRTLNPSDAAYTYTIDPSYRAIAHPPLKFSFAEYCAYLESLWKEFPEYAVRIKGLDSVIDEDDGWANVFMEMELEGVPAGVVRKSVAVVRWRRGIKGEGEREGVWMCFEYEAADGVEVKGLG